MTRNLTNYDSSNLKPYGPRVTCEAPPDMDNNKSSIILPDGIKMDLTAAIVIGVGEVAEDVALPYLEPGDMIFFSHVCNRLGDMYIIEFGCIVAYEKLGGGEGHGEGSLAS